MENVIENNATNNIDNKSTSKLKIFLLMLFTAIITLMITLGTLYILNTYIPKTQVQKTISDYYSSMKEGNLDNLLKIYPKDIAKQAKQGYDLSPEMKKSSSEMLKLMSEKTTYKIKNISINGDNATVEITETTIDQQELQAKAQELAAKQPLDIKQDDPQAQIKYTKYQIDILKLALKEVNKTKDNDVDVKLIKEDKKWVISPDSAGIQ